MGRGPCCRSTTKLNTFFGCAPQVLMSVVLKFPCFVVMYVVIYACLSFEVHDYFNYTSRHPGPEPSSRTVIQDHHPGPSSKTANWNRQPEPPARTIIQNSQQEPPAGTASQNRQPGPPAETASQNHQPEPKARTVSQNRLPTQGRTANCNRRGQVRPP